jgi:hypothetical protein
VPTSLLSCLPPRLCCTAFTIVLTGRANYVNYRYRGNKTGYAAPRIGQDSSETVVAGNVGNNVGNNVGTDIDRSVHKGSSSMVSKYLPWVLVGYIMFVFLQSLVFKFSGSQETVIIFDTIADWMLGLAFLVPIAEGFRAHGGLLVGITELLACGLLIFAVTRVWGALLAMGTISGAIFFHLFTPLGINRVVDEAGNTDGGVLFFMACGVWLCSAALVYMNRADLPGFGGR